MPFLSTYTYLPHSYLPTYLIIPSGPLGAISDLHTERHDGFTARLCVRRRYTRVSAEPSRTELSWAEPSWSAPRLLVDFVPFCSYFRKSEERLAHTNSAIAMRCVFSFSYSLIPRSAFTGIVALCTPRGIRTVPFVDKFINVFGSLRVIRSSLVRMLPK